MSSEAAQRGQSGKVALWVVQFILIVGLVTLAYYAGRMVGHGQGLGAGYGHRPKKGSDLPEALASAEKRLADAAETKHEWTPVDEAAFLGDLSKVSFDTRLKLRRKWSQLVNEGKLKRAYLPTGPLGPCEPDAKPCNDGKGSEPSKPGADVRKPGDTKAPAPAAAGKPAKAK